MPSPQNPIRVVIAEDNLDLSAALCALVEQEPDMDLVGHVDRCDGLLAALRDGAANVVVLDLNLGGQSSIAQMRVVWRELPELAVVVYSGYDFAEVAGTLRSLGPCEYVSKSGDAAELLAAVRRAVAKKTGAGS
jgi:DNA-binding NarL/FixJ family response regulator